MSSEPGGVYDTVRSLTGIAGGCTPASNTAAINARRGRAAEMGNRNWRAFLTGRDGSGPTEGRGALHPPTQVGRAHGRRSEIAVSIGSRGRGGTAL